MFDDPPRSNLSERPAQPLRRATKLEEDRHVVAAFWLAVQRMLRRKSEASGPSTAEWYPPKPDLDHGGSNARVPRRPVLPPGTAAAAADLPEDDSASSDIQRH